MVEDRHVSAAPRRTPTAGEEIANSVSHGIGLLAAAVASPVLIVVAVRRGEPAGVVGAAVFAATMILLYLSSTLYHALSWSRAGRLLRVLDHTAIYLLIAGTYTPFTLGVLRGGWGWTLFGLIWGMAAAGILMKSIHGFRRPVLSALLYLAMGWLVVIAVRPLIANVPAQGLAWLAAGGLAYTAGVVFYALHRVRYAHLIWHLFVLAGTACHFVAVLLYAS